MRDDPVTLSQSRRVLVARVVMVVSAAVGLLPAVPSAREGNSKSTIGAVLLAVALVGIVVAMVLDAKRAHRNR